MTKQKKKIDEARIEKAVREILSAVGEDLNRDGSVNVADLQLLIDVVIGARACP